MKHAIAAACGTQCRAAVWIIAAFALLAPGPARAQLAPDRAYYGVNRPIPMTVKIPADVAGEPSIKLFAPQTTEPVASAAVSPGPVNLATLFPQLWTGKSPALVYAQLVVGDRRVGSPVVLQPMVDMQPARLDASGRRAVFPPRGPESTYSGIRAYAEKRVVLDTTQGEIEFAMRPDAAPNTVWNFLELVEGGFYTDIIFHRIVAKLPSGAAFVVQAGDPTGTGSGGPGYAIDLENSSLPHDFGVLSMARSGDPNSNGSQVFICLSRDGTSFLDTQYTSFAQLTRGAEVVKAIAAVPVGPGDRPADPPRIKSARAIPAPPFGEAAAGAETPKR
ncbi:MAG: peptidylprolyl isomerase [Phycisphaerales bacterium]|nr:peptidylprolyl isomerase [Phycisphaerales bacterium]